MPQKPLPTKNCEYCNQPFIQIRKGQRFCSKSCRVNIQTVETRFIRKADHMLDTAASLIGMYDRFPHLLHGSLIGKVEEVGRVLAPARQRAIKAMQDQQQQVIDQTDQNEDKSDE